MTRALMLFAAVSLGLASAIACYFESLPFVRSSPDERSLIKTLAAEAPAGGLSIYANKLALDDCSIGIGSIRGRLQPPEERRTLLDNCQRFANGVGKRMPTFAYAWYIAAHAALELRKEPDAWDALWKAYLSAPNESWMAELRLGLLIDRYSSLEERIAGAGKRDITMLLLTDRGAAWLAGKMLNNANFSDIVIKIAESMDKSTQDRLMGNLNKAAEKRI